MYTTSSRKTGRWSQDVTLSLLRIHTAAFIPFSTKEQRNSILWQKIHSTRHDLKKTKKRRGAPRLAFQPAASAVTKQDPPTKRRSMHMWPAPRGPFIARLSLRRLAEAKPNQGRSKRVPSNAAQNNQFGSKTKRWCFTSPKQGSMAKTRSTSPSAVLKVERLLAPFTWPRLFNPGVVKTTGDCY